MGFYGIYMDVNVGLLHCESSIYPPIVEAQHLFGLR
uniref:Uncharacterized protein n=1 Tax=Anguilla anguilla TaxID=7936 RepID=A0A0E9WLM9_ANGAN